MTIALKTASEIAARAAELVGGERETQHGNKIDNFTKIATMWNAYLDIRPDYDAPLDATDVGHMMAAMKLARTQLGSLNIDDYVDGAGYFACAGEVAVAADDARIMVPGVDRASNPFWNNYANSESTNQTPKLKVGDKVRPTWTTLTDWGVGTVKAIGPSGQNVHIEWENYSPVGESWCDVNSIVKAKAEPKFKVGDKVYLLAFGYDTNHVRTITHIAGNTVWMDCICGGRLECNLLSEIALVPA